MHIDQYRKTSTKGERIVYYANLYAAQTAESADFYPTVIPATSHAPILVNSKISE